MAICLLIAAATLGTEAPNPPEPPIDYLVRAELIGYEDADPKNGPPAETLLRSVETLCRPGQPFLGRSTCGNETFTVRGALEEPSPGEFVGRFACIRVVDPGVEVPISPGVTQKVLDTVSTGGTIALTLDRPLDFGSLISDSTDTLSDGSVRRRASKLVFRSKITKYDAGNE